MIHDIEIYTILIEETELASDFDPPQSHLLFLQNT